MKIKDIKPGTIVYHSIFTHWGKGRVIRTTGRNLLERLFGRGKILVEVKFDTKNNVVRMRPNELRKTPNKKKIRDMVSLYATRGVVAKDGGDRLILPDGENCGS